MNKNPSAMKIADSIFGLQSGCTVNQWDAENITVCLNTIKNSGCVYTEHEMGVCSVDAPTPDCTSHMVNHQKGYRTSVLQVDRRNVGGTLGFDPLLFPSLHRWAALQSNLLLTQAASFATLSECLFFLCFFPGDVQRKKSQGCVDACLRVPIL